MGESQDMDEALSVFGPRLRELRAGRGWTLAELAERSGLSKPFLSRLEAADRQPSIAAVLTLAKVFGVSVGALLDPVVEPAAEPCLVVRGGGAKPRGGDGLSYVPLSNADRFANLQPIRLTVSHRRAGDEQFRHDGQEWLYVLAGRLRVTVAGVDHDLEAGDAAHFDSQQPHRLTALGGRDAELILVACPLPDDDPRPTPRARRQRRAIR